MTEEEVQEIYDYLHENYRYEDGNLINKKTNRLVGCIQTRNQGSSTSVTIGFNNLNGKPTSKMLSHAIWIYHYKKDPKYIHHKDGNIMNFDINNLESHYSPTRLHTKLSEVSKGFSKSSKNSKKPFTARVQFNRKSIHLGTYNSPEEAKKVYELAKKLLLVNISNKTELIAKLKIIYPNLNVKHDQNKLGIKGVYMTKNYRYAANIRRKNKSINLGTYNTSEQAHAAYLKAKEEYAQRA